MLEDLLKKIQSSKINNKLSGHWLVIIAVAVIFLILFVFIIFFELVYTVKFFPRSRISSTDLSNLTISQALDKIENKTNKISQDGFSFIYQSDNQEKISPLEIPEDPDVSGVDLLFFDIHQTVYGNFQLGHNNNLFLNIVQQLDVLSGHKKLSASYKLNEELLINLLKQQFKSLEQPAINSAPNIECEKNNCQITILPEKQGLLIDYNGIIKEIKDNLNQLENRPIKVNPIISQPQIKQIEVSNKQNEIQTILNASSTEFTYQDKRWILSKKSLSQLIEFQKIGNKIAVGINQDKFFDWFKLNISPELDLPAKNASLEIKDGKVNKLSTHQNGLEADKEEAYNDFNQKIINNSYSVNQITIITKEVYPEVTTDQVNDLGIKEIIGTGQSSFAGSPTNRRKNIKNGAAKLHGLLIKPDEEFSLIKALLPVDAANGYFPELVIKGNKTTAEYGGGLCQIGTTVFRAALASGLPILERQNHSYNVTYYLENGLPGVDATIYDPKPDLRFKNDTGNYILIQARIEGDKLYFDFWGINDGRTATRTKPKVWGWKDPLPTKIIESNDLKPGEQKCTEVSHKGVSASFNYIVDYSDGHTATTTFSSVYRPWQAVCLIGVVATTTSELLIIP
ncbi:MAG: VanW family protein [Patescibacteria group bacterium]|jgi:vancomycin resistance protein YoaR